MAGGGVRVTVRGGVGVAHGAGAGAGEAVGHGVGLPAQKPDVRTSLGYLHNLIICNLIVLRRIGQCERLNQRPMIGVDDDVTTRDVVMKMSQGLLDGL